MNGLFWLCVGIAVQCFVASGTCTTPPRGDETGVGREGSRKDYQDLREDFQVRFSSLPPNTSEKRLKAYIKKVTGKNVPVYIPRDRDTGDLYDVGFAYFRDMKSMDDAVFEMMGVPLDKHDIKVTAVRQ